MEKYKRKDNNEVPVEGSIDKPLRRITEGSFDAALSTARIIEDTPNSPENKRRFRDKLTKSLQKFSRIISFTAVLSGAVGVSDYHLTRYKVEQKVDNHGNISYSHEDPETTHVINLLSGKDKLREFDKQQILLEVILNKFDMDRKAGVHIEMDEEDLYRMSFDELKKIAESFMNSESFDKLLVMMNPSPAEFDPELYNALWILEQDFGSPKVRFRLGEDKKILGFYKDDNLLGFYNPVTNTIFIDLGINEYSISNYLNEAAHSLQFNQKPVQSSFTSLHGILASAFSSVFSGKISDRYLDLYKIAGTFENEAHQKIAPKLKARLDQLTPVRVAKLREEMLRVEEESNRISYEMKKIDIEEDIALRKAYNVYYQETQKTKDPNSIRLLIGKHARNVDRIHELYLNKRLSLYESFEIK
jgi:hypothetical protein